jgi:prophage maintenance system killer protein
MAWMEGTIGPVGGLSPAPGPPAQGLPVAPKRHAKGKVRFDLAAIERSLRAVQRDFDRINATLETPRDPLRDQVITNLMAGYAYLDTSLAHGHNPLAPGHSADLLQLNHLVLCGTDEADLKDAAKHLAETAAGFYDTTGPGGVADLMNTLAAHRDEPVWRQAARAYIQVMSQPQLFIEGNHRTGALIMSALLAGEGKPPFVLTVSNAKAYFDPSTLAKDSRKHSLQLFLRQPKLRKRLAELLKSEADWGFLRP